MLWRDDDHKFVTVDQNHRQARIADRHGNHSEVDRVVDYRIQNLGVVGALYVDCNVRILLLELGKNLGKDVQARAFVGPYDDLSSRHALSFGDRGAHGLARTQSVFCGPLEELAGSGDVSSASGAVDPPRREFS